MNTANAKIQKRTRRHARIRATISGTAECPRLAVFRSNTALYAQLIDDVAGRTLAAANTRTMKEEGLRARARALGATLAARAKADGIERVVFDRGGFLYAGAIREVAEGAREGGLKF